MTDSPEEMRTRTKQFALRIIRLYQALPQKAEAQVLGKQLLRSGTSVAASYRAACRARSRPEFIAKIGVALEEADESVFWLELVGESEILPMDKLESILDEANQLTAILSATRSTSRGR